MKVAKANWQKCDTQCLKMRTSKLRNAQQQKGEKITTKATETERKITTITKRRKEKRREEETI